MSFAHLIGQEGRTQIVRDRIGRDVGFFADQVEGMAEIVDGACPPGAFRVGGGIQIIGSSDLAEDVFIHMRFSSIHKAVWT
ncbi:hypothetical protein SDC9_128710 [bioreactor metagenome]|uniref:Uncharacterized protein n=1 Tax=bioreactor metagenome TaxID=1076179 RepID=A0A645CXQ2_9ZZZZ